MYSNVNYFPPRSTHIQNDVVRTLLSIIPDWLIKLSISWAGQKRGSQSEGLGVCGVAEGPQGGERKEVDMVNVTRSMWPRETSSKDWPDGAEAAQVEHVQVFMGILDGKKTR